MSAIEKDAVNVRRMTRSDLDTVVVLYNRVGRGRSPVTYRDLVANYSGGPFDFSLVAEVKGQIVGFILARLEFVYIPLVEVCLVHAVGVDPEYRRLHIGSALINELAYYCRLEGINTIRTLVRQTHDELRSFIERQGFRPSDITNWDKAV